MLSHTESKVAPVTIPPLAIVGARSSGIFPSISGPTGAVANVVLDGCGMVQSPSCPCLAPLAGPGSGEVHSPV